MRYKSRHYPRWKRAYRAHLNCSARGSYDKYIYHQHCAKRVRQVKRKLNKSEKKAFWRTRFAYR